VKGALLLNVVVAQGAAVFQLLTSEDKTLLIRRNTLLVLDLALHVIDGVARFDLKRDRLSGQSLDENLHTTTKSEDEMKGALLLNVVVRQSTTILELLASKDKALLVGRDTLLVLNLALHVVDGVARLDLECDRLSGQSLDEDLHTTSKTEDEMERRLLLNVVVGESAAILKLLASENQALLVRGDALLILNLRLDVVDGIRGLDLKGDGLAGQSLDEDLHTTAKAEDKVKGGLLLDVVVGEGATVLKLLASENQALLIGGDALLILDLRLDVVDGIRGLNLKGDGLASERLDEDLHRDGLRAERDERWNVCKVVWSEKAVMTARKG
jgi:hypothetical protein